MHQTPDSLALACCSLILPSLVVWMTTITGCTASEARRSARVVPPTGEAAQLWAPVEWTLDVPPPPGQNPFDVRAAVEFVHRETGERRSTEMFYAGGDHWKFRFTGTRTGEWSYSTSSVHLPLHGHRGSVAVHPNPDPKARGFVTGLGSKWGWSGTGEVFVPQLVMYGAPPYYHENPGRIDADIQTFLVEHGFTGFHTEVFCRWFDLEEQRCGEIGHPDPNPDPRTFEALELLIRKVYGAGGMVHLWMWGDNQRTQTPTKWGVDDPVDRRLQRYIAARLGPLPGWTMGYGFDLWEWTDDSKLAQWHRYLHAHFGWPHLLGARSEKNRLTQLSEAMDYASYEQHRPDYDMYVRTLERRPGKPAFSEDRFRVRESRYPEKDYTMEMTRRGLWHSAMAGGVANIWGYLLPREGEPSRSGSNSFPRPDWIRTYARFFNQRLQSDMSPCNELTDYRPSVTLEAGSLHAALCDRRAARFLFYAEDTWQVRMDLSGMPEAQPAVAIDALKPYEEIHLGLLDLGTRIWEAPYPSTWAIAVGRFPRGSSPNPSGTVPRSTNPTPRIAP
jgi:hypothetical protein